MKKPYIVGVMNSLLIPLSVYCGILLDKGNTLAIIPLSICMTIEFAVTIIWFKINQELWKDEVK